MMAEIFNAPAEIVQKGADASQNALTFDDLLGILQKRHIAALAAVAGELGRPEQDVTACARAHPAELGLIGDPPTIVFEKTVATASQG